MKLNSIGFNKNLLSLMLLVFRIFLGFAMITHGYPKLQMLISGDKIEFMSFLGLSAKASLGLTVFSEFVCSIFLILGLFTRFALVPLIITMSVAVFEVHIHDDFGKMELALHYLSGYLLLLVSGPGKFSIDGMIGKKKSDWQLVKY